MSEAREPAAVRVAVARVRRPWGVDGSVAVTPYSDAPDRLAPGKRVYAAGHEYTVVSVKRAGGGLVLALEGVRSAAGADGLRGQELEVPAAELPAQPPGVYYHYQIIGARVVAVTGEPLGTVTEIIETPGNDVYVVVPDAGGQELLLPALKGIISRVDAGAGVIYVDLPEWLLRGATGSQPGALHRRGAASPGGG